MRAFANISKGGFAAEHDRGARQLVETVATARDGTDRNNALKWSVGEGCTTRRVLRVFRQARKRITDSHH